MTVALAQSALRELVAGPGKATDRIASAARACGLAYSRVYEIHYGRARTIRDEERAAIADALEARRAQEARNELHELRVRLARLEGLLASSDPDFHRPDIAALRGVDRMAMRAGGAADRAVDRGVRRP